MYIKMPYYVQIVNKKIRSLRENQLMKRGRFYFSIHAFVKAFWGYRGCQYF